jgi:cytosine/adenosine deaminase-related metal-dependent hydrolase
MEFISKVFLHDDVSTLRMFTESNAEILKEDCGVIAEGKNANLVVLNEKSNNIKNVSNLISGAVRRARPDDIVSVIYRGKCLKKSL